LNFLESLRMALVSLRANKMRSFLTMLGVIIGVGAVIMMVSLGLGARNEISSSIEAIGSNLIIVVPGKIDLSNAMGKDPSQIRGGLGVQVNRLRPELAEFLQENIPEGYYAAPIMVDTRKMNYGTREHFTQVIGTNENYPQVRGYTMDEGRFFNRSDGNHDVCVIGPNVAEVLFGGMEPLEKQITIGSHRFTVIGVTAPKGSTFFINNDDMVWIPYNKMSSYFGKTLADNILVQAPDKQGVDEVEPVIKDLMSKQRLSEFEYTVITQDDLVAFADSILRILTYLLGAIAGISLLVGGIGIMNIMLVSVTERTREIGIRKAIGAKTKDVMFQFLLESITISTVGGIIGIILAWTGATIVSHIIDLPNQMTLWAICLAFFFSAGVGVFFGVYPATKAASLDPITSLRHE
jgi:putative ABC transport system permease protein